MKLPGIPDELAAIFAEEAAELLARLEGTSVGIGEPVAGGHGAAVRRMRRDLHTLKGSAGAVGLEAAGAGCHALEEFLADHLDGEPLSGEAIAHLMDGLASLRRTCLGSATSSISMTVEPVPIRADGPSLDEPVAGHDTIRVAVSRVDALHSSLGQLIVARLQAADLGQEAGALRGDLAQLLGGWRELAANLRVLRGQLPEAVWRDLEGRLGGFGQKLRKVERRGAVLARRSAEQASHVGVVSDALERGIKQVRMLPLGPWFSGFAVSVAEAARSREVKAELRWEDHGLEADRGVVEALRGPLLHLVRNAVAHGIESPPLRMAKGKPAMGTIVLEAKLDGDHLVIAVRDDGRGVDREGVARRAAELGLIAPGESLDDADLLRMLATSGFSTAESVDGVAGRGIGLDAVAHAVHGLRGTVRLRSEGEGGTEFRLRVPASVTTTQGLVLTVGPYRFGMPLDVVTRVLRTTRSSIETLEGSAVLYVGGDPVTVTSLADLVGALDHGPPDDFDHVPSLVLQVGPDRLAILVDDVPAELPMVVRRLGRQFVGVPWLSGAAVEADGAVLAVLDPRGLMDLARTRRRTSSRAVAQPAPELSDAVVSAVRRVLVVDDSVTMRTLQRNILESAGFDVLVAGDGQEARDRLRTEVAIDLVVTDVDMPRMNGLELCAWIRASAFADLPVLVVTSLDSEEERRQGLAAGADAYLVKGNFQQDHYVATIRRLCG